MYFQCKFCNKSYKGRIPKGGDGTGWIIRKHYRHIPRSTNLGIMPISDKELCPGSYQLVTIEDSRNDKISN